MSTEPTATESIEFDVPDDVSSLTPEEPGPYRTLLEVWRAVLEPAVANELRHDPISPQWATKMVTTYPGVGFRDVEAIHHGVFDLAAELAELLNEEIATDDECLKKASAEEDAQENAGHYKYMLAAWQVHLVQAERIEELGDHFRLRGEGDVLPGADLAVAQTHQVERDAAPRPAQLADDVTPVVAVERHPVYEQRRRPAALLDVGDAPGRSARVAP